jgi:valacyclovir hydrolase
VTAGHGDHHIVCIPGALGTAMSDYKPQLEHFGRGGSNFTITSFDPIGYGKGSSSRPREFAIKPIHFLDQDGMDAYHGMTLHPGAAGGRFSVFGWSDGGVAGLFLASRFPSAVRKLVIWGANAYVSREDIEGFESIRDISGWSENMRKSLESIYGYQLGEMWSSWVDSMVELYHKHDGNLCMDLLSNIQCPTLILHGECDPLVPSFHPLYLKDNIKNSILHSFPDGKHNIHLKFANDFNNIVEDFLLS